jgi:chromosomal replication initiator protein
LEGTIIRILAFASITKSDISLDLVKSILSDSIVKKETKKISIDDIIDTVSKYYKIPTNNLREKNRSKEVAHCRQVAMYISKMYTNYSLKSIGLHFGGRDHSTVIHAVKQISKNKEKDKILMNDINYILSKLGH